MQLRDLLVGVSDTTISGSTDGDISTIAYDSRKVQPGGVFVAIRGAHVDGHRYIAQAIERGARAVVYDDSSAWRDDFAATGVRVPNARVALAPLSAAYYGVPGESMRVVGITGTDGKTTTTWLASVALEANGGTTGLMGTVDFKIGARVWANDTRQSTPEALEVQALLREMADAGCEHAVVEATSHALSARWNRLGGCAFDIAVLTNVTHEHLDYHGTVEQYRRDKARLFEMLGEAQEPKTKNQKPNPLNTPPVLGSRFSVLKQRKIAIVNGDDPHHQMFLDAAPASAERLRYAVHRDAEVRAHDVQATRDGLFFRVATPWGEAAPQLKLTGDFNVHNALAALSVALVEGVPLDAAVRALEAVPGVRGRMERIDQGQPFTVLVDYAHTPGAFEKLMRIVRPLTSGKLIAVFGSAGERDRDKRPIQGEIAARFCDLVVIADEDPRGEDSEEIIAEIAAGAVRAGKRLGVDCVCIADRTAAIRRAFEEAAPGDMVLLLGKGHEGSMIYAEHALPWDEAGVARAVLRDLGYGR